MIVYTLNAALHVGHISMCLITFLLPVDCVARQVPSRALSGYPVILVCSQRPAAPVNWSFRHLPDSEPQHIVTEGSIVSDRFDIDGSSLIIRKVQPSYDGAYVCCDANKDVFTYNVTVVGEEITNRCLQCKACVQCDCVTTKQQYKT